MFLTRHQTPQGARLALGGFYLPREINLKMLLALPGAVLSEMLQSLPTSDSADQPLLPPLEPDHEVWASGVTYLRSREARERESDVRDVYERVYSAERPELFFKSVGWRVVGHGMPIRVRHDSHWNVPEPELTLVINSLNEIIGYTIGNDVSSRDIEGTNPLYLPQAKMYNGSCALGPGIVLATTNELSDMSIELEVIRDGRSIFSGGTRSSQMKRTLGELVEFLTREMDFPYGGFLMTGTGIVPGDDFSLRSGDIVLITIGSFQLENPVSL